jgi:nucleoside-diphosphate-sugar epimerase
VIAAIRGPVSSADGRILITGGGGFLGQHLVERLVALGCEVHITSRQERSGRQSARWWRCDVASESAVEKVFAATRPDIVVHLSGSTGAQPDVARVLPTFHSLATSTVNVLVHATNHGCRRVILAGSFNEPIAGIGMPVPGSPYGAAKWVASAYGRMFHRLYGLPVVILRPFMVYGPRQGAEKLVPAVTRSLLQGVPPRISSGRTRCDWVYVDDVIDTFLIAMSASGLEGETFDIGTGQLTSIREVVQKLVDIIDANIAPQFGALPDRPLEEEPVAETNFAALKLGWRATTPLDVGLRKTVEWYRSEL